MVLDTELLKLLYINDIVHIEVLNDVSTSTSTFCVHNSTLVYLYTYDTLTCTRRVYDHIIIALASYSIIYHTRSTIYTIVSATHE